MRKILEAIITFIAELIGLVGGIIWAINTNWDYEPLILIAISLVGIIAFIVLCFLPSDDDKPLIEMELVFSNGYRFAPSIINNVSPKNEKGQYFIKKGGVYYFRLIKEYKFIVRNNSKNTAYNLVFYKLKGDFPLNFKTKYNSLEPLIIDKPRSMDLLYEVNRPMKHDEAEKIWATRIPDDITNWIIIAQYQSESRNTYYTKFTPLNKNESVNKIFDLNNYDKI